MNTYREGEVQLHALTSELRMGVSDQLHAPAALPPVSAGEEAA